MKALAIAVVLFGALSVLNLLLLFGVLRRLREGVGSRPQPGGAVPGPPMAPVGTIVQGTTASWDGETLVGFFTPGCGPCEQQLPAFIEYARSANGRWRWSSTRPATLPSWFASWSRSPG